MRNRRLALLKMKGMIRLNGFVADPENSDVIVWGRKEQGGAPIHAEDPVVALRAAHGRISITIKETEIRQFPVIPLDSSGEGLNE